MARRNRGRINNRRKDLDLTLVSLNCRSINNKKESVKEILENLRVDIALCSELNLNWKPPRMKGYMAFHKKAKKRFHGLAMYVAEHLCESVLRIPDEDEELEIIHLLVTKKKRT